MLYGAIVAQARQPAFYAAMGVPDTVQGRMEMVMLHTILVTRRLYGDDSAKTLGQSVFDVFCLDMDRSMRELGVSDMAVPKRMRRVGEAFYGRAGAYEAALAGASGNELIEALGRNVFGDTASEDGARALAAYVQASAAGLAGASLDALADGDLPFPDPGAYIAGARSP